MELLENNVYKQSRLIKEPSNITSIGVLNSYNQKCLLGSDVQDWNEYEKGTFSELKYDFDGYENFLKLLDKDTSYITDLLSKKCVGNVRVYGDSSRELHPFEIKYYNDVNVIFGDRGSGKSEILYSLAKYFETNSINALTYSGGEKDAWFSELLQVSINDYSFLDMKLTDNLSSCFDYIKTFQDITPVAIKEYVNHFVNQSKNANSKKIKIIHFNKNNDSSLQAAENLFGEYRKIESFISSFTNMTIYKANPIKYDNLLKELNKASSDAFQLFKKKWVSYYSNKLFDFTIEKIGAAIASCVGVTALPAKTGFYEFASRRIDLIDSCISIDTVLKSKEVTISNTFIGYVGDKGSGSIAETIRFINADNIDLINSSFQNSRKTKYASFFKQIDKVIKSAYKDNLQTVVSELKATIETNEISDIDYFLCPIKSFALNNHPYDPSKGEKCILSMQYELISVKDEYSVFLIDEPESGLGNDYIEKNIVTLIKELAKSGKTVFVATHNPNIAVRTLPATSILKLVDNGKYLTYQGSMFTNVLKNIENENDIKVWSIESEIHLEGGKKAFEERGYYYAETD